MRRASKIGLIAAGRGDMMRALKLILIAIGTVALAPAAVQAGSITEDFTITVNPAADLFGVDNFASSSFAQFNPALGTLVDFQTTLTGSATWTSFGLTREAFLVLPSANIAVAPVQDFTTILGDTVDFNISGTHSTDFADFMGTGTTHLNLRLIDEPTTTFKTSTDGLSGSITYDFTSVVPEPGSLTLLGAGLLGLWFARRQRRA